MTQHAVAFGKKTIRFSLEQKARKSFKIGVLPDLSVEVSAPDRLPLEKVLARVRQRAPWILRQIDYFNGFLPQQPPRKYISGETHCYLGRQYKLKVERAPKGQVKLKRAHIVITLPRVDAKQEVKRLLYGWYRARAKDIFMAKVQLCYERLTKYSIPLPKVDIKIMKSRWGSCVHTKGRIGLNIELVKAPSHSIEYVIMHELCHLKHPNHTKEFYKFLSLVMPDWEKRKTRLEKVLL